MASLSLAGRKAMSQRLQDAIACGDVVHAVREDGQSVFVIKAGVANRGELRSEIEKHKRGALGAGSRVTVLGAVAVLAAVVLLLRLFSN